MVRAGERIHVIGIAGSGAAGTAAPAPPRRGHRRRLRRRRALALHAAARRGRHPVRHRPRSGAPRRRRSGRRSRPRSAPCPSTPSCAAAASRHRRSSRGRRCSASSGGTGAHRPRRDRHPRQVDHDRAARPPARRRRAGSRPSRSAPSSSAWGASVRAGGGAPFLVEADEFGDNFLNYHPAGAIVTNVEMDHPDYFADRGAVHGLVRALRARHGAPSGPRRPPAARRRRRPGRDRARRTAARLGGPDRALRARRRRSWPPTSSSGRWARRFTLFDRRWRCALAGEHNVLNATAALHLARALGADLERPGRGPAHVRRSRAPHGADRRYCGGDDLRRLRAPPDRGAGRARRRPAAGRPGPTPVGRLRAAHVLAHRAPARRVRHRLRRCGRGRHRRHLRRRATRRRRWPPRRPRPWPMRSSGPPAVPAIATGDVDATTAYVADHLGDRRRRAGHGGREVVPHRPRPRRSAGGGVSSVIGARSVVLGALLALAVTIAYQARRAPRGGLGGP